MDLNAETMFLEKRQPLLEAMPIQHLAERTILNHSARSQKKGNMQETSIY
jgi:hypothetical protein